MIDLNKKLIEIASKIANQISHNNSVIVTMDSNFDDDLVFDSLDSVEFIMELEMGFDIQIPDDLAEEMTYKLKTLRDILPVLKEKYGIYDIKIERKEKLDEIDEKNKL